MKHKCWHCSDNLEEINTNPIQSVWAGIGDTEERVQLWVCLSADCKNRGVILAIPITAKED